MNLRRKVSSARDKINGKNKFQWGTIMCANVENIHDANGKFPRADGTSSHVRKFPTRFNCPMWVRLSQLHLAYASEFTCDFYLFTYFSSAQFSIRNFHFYPVVDNVWRQPVDRTRRLLLLLFHFPIEQRERRGERKQIGSSLTAPMIVAPIIIK